MLVIAFAFQAAFEHLRQRITQASAEIFSQNLTNRVFSLVIQTELTRGGREAAQPVRDLDLLRNFFTGQGPIAILDLPWMLIFLAVLFVFHWLLGVVCLIGALLLVGLTILTDRLTAAQVEAATVSSSQRSTFIEACRRNAEVIGALGMRGQMQDSWRKMSDQHAGINDEAGDKLSAMRTFSKTFRLLLQSLTSDRPVRRSCRNTRRWNGATACLRRCRGAARSNRRRHCGPPPRWG
jgi:ABC-type protease/lipase transport system fused ATPase/permease subunit